MLKNAGECFKNLVSWILKSFYSYHERVDFSWPFLVAVPLNGSLDFPEQMVQLCLIP